MHKTRANPSRKRRTILERIEKFPVCDPDEAAKQASSYLDGGNVNFDITCEIQDSNCRFKLTCNFEEEAWICKDGEHIYTNVACCNFIATSFS